MATEYGSSSPVDPSKVVCDLREASLRLKCAQFAIKYSSEEGGEAAEAVIEEVNQCLEIIEQEADEVSHKALYSVYLLPDVYKRLYDRCKAIEDDTFDSPAGVMQVIVNSLVAEVLDKDRISWPQAKKRYKVFPVS